MRRSPRPWAKRSEVGRPGQAAAASSAAGAAYTSHVTGAYARIREQFHVAIAKFEAVQERLGRMAATAYLLDAARRMTCAALDDGHHPAVITAKRLRFTPNQQHSFQRPMHSRRHTNHIHRIHCVGLYEVRLRKRSVEVTQIRLNHIHCAWRLSMRKSQQQCRRKQGSRLHLTQ